MIRVQTGSRLHFGLFSLPSENVGPWPNQEGEPKLPRRNFGGVGLMIARPGIELTVERGREWSASGPLAARALGFARAYARVLQTFDAFQIHVHSAASEHCGLGTGTQLGMAVSKAVHVLIKQCDILQEDLALAIGRGQRSAVGIHGFRAGGFLIEGGRRADSSISPLIFRRASISTTN